MDRGRKISTVHRNSNQRANTPPDRKISSAKKNGVRKGSANTYNKNSDPDQNSVQKRISRTNRVENEFKNVDSVRRTSSGDLGVETTQRTRKLSSVEAPVLDRRDSDTMKAVRKTSVDKKHRQTSLPTRDSSASVDQAAEIDKLLENDNQNSQNELTKSIWTGIDKTAGATYRVLSGKMDDIPPLSSKIVRIFTSSTFTDTTVERNTLMEKVYPQLKDYCRDKHGLEFQIVDMRWGVRDEMTDDHKTIELCLTEIENCKRVSLGPNFVLFLGHKYGYRPLQRVIPASLVEQILDVIVDVDKELLTTWYRRDENAIPPVYILKPISSILVNYNNKRLKSLQKQDRQAWESAFKRISSILRRATSLLLEKGKIDEDTAADFKMSVTEREVTEGILEANDTSDHCLAFIRALKDCDFNKMMKNWKYIDTDEYDKINEEAQALLTVLKDEKLPAKLPPGNLSRYEIACNWKRNITMKEQPQYIENFCEDFKNKIIELVERGVVKQNDLSAATYRETLQHLHACRNFCQLFQGRDDIVQRVKTYVLSDSRLPLVLYGESGCGKTSLLAKCTSMVTNWLQKPDANVIIRFLGTTPDSSSIRPLLTSICEQLCFLYEQPTSAIPSDLLSLQNHMKTLLELSSEENPLVILLDSLDQLSGQDGAHQLTWLPGELPAHAKIVVSTLPKYYCLLATLQGKIRNAENFVEVTQLGEDLGTAIIESWLNNADRKLTVEQWTIVKEAINKCNLPLFIRLVFKEICKWKSYTPLEHTVLAADINESIMRLFARIENTHGQTLVSHALGYITAAKTGVSEAELEDLLSLDDLVLNDVYQYHVPPIRRIPPLLWTRIRNDLPRYLTEREADDVTVINWFHRQFLVAAKERYFKNLNFQSLMHKNLAEYFLGVWGGKPKPFKYTETQKQLENRKTDTGESDRKVPTQQTIVHDNDGNVIRYNLRKLSELPYHLVKSHLFTTLCSEVLFNYKWLHAKISCMPLQATIADFEFALEVLDDKEIRMLADALRLSSSILSSNPDMLGPQIVGRLLPYYTRTTKIRSLIDQCDREGLEKNALIPSYQCLHVPGGPLQYSFEGHTLSCYGITVTSDDHYLVSVSNRMIIWDLLSGTVFRVIEPGIKSVMQTLVLDPQDRFAVAQTRGSNQIVLFSMISGEARVLDSPCVNKDEPIIGVNIVTDYFCVWSNTEWYLLTVTPALDTQIHTCGRSTKDKPIVSIEMRSDQEMYIIKGRENGHSVEKINHKHYLEFNQALVFNTGGSIIYTCVAETKNDIVKYETEETLWKLSGTVAKNTDSVYSLTLSPNEHLLIATVQSGFKVWSLKEPRTYVYNYPHGHRNFPTKHYSKSLVTFTKDNKYLIAASKKKLFVWKLQESNPIRELDDHFERIVCLLARSSWCTDFVLTSSLDQTVKVWNIKNILESSNPIARMDRAIEQITFAENTYMAATITRNGLGIWDLESGQIKNQWNYNGKGIGIVTQAAITSDARYCISCENGKNGHVITWDMSNGTAIHVAEGRPDALHIILNENETKAITFNKVQGQSTIRCVCQEIPNGKVVYEMSYPFLPPARKPLLTPDGLYILALSSTKSGQPCLQKYHSKTGVLLDSATVRYPKFKPITDFLPMNGDEEKVVFVDEEKANVWDMVKKELAECILHWSGLSTQCGRYGVHAPQTGGVYMLDLTDNGQVAKVFLDRTNEGAHATQTAFSSNDTFLLYYHSGHRSVRVFNVWGRRRVRLDGQCIANYNLSAELRVMRTTPGGGYVVLGCADGTVTTLTIALPGEAAGTFGRERLCTVRRRYYEAEFVFDESFRPVLKDDLVEFADVVSEMLKVKNEGTEKADTMEEWIAEQKEKAALEDEDSYVNKFVKHTRKDSVKEDEIEDEKNDVVDGESNAELNGDADNAESAGNMTDAGSTVPTSEHVSELDEDNCTKIDTEVEILQQNEEEPQQIENGEEQVCETAPKRETSFDGLKSLKPSGGPAMNWSFAVMGVVVNDVAMGPAKEEAQRLHRMQTEEESKRLGLGGAVTVARAVGKTRRWRAARKAQATQREYSAGGTLRPNAKSVTCVIS